MSTGDFPQIQSCTYSDNTNSALPINYMYTTDRTIGSQPWPNINMNELLNPCSEVFLNNKKDSTIKEPEEVSERRLVKVMIVDPDLNVPVENAVLVNEQEKITDLDDQELFFELDIKNILDVHNQYRASIVNKKKSTEDKTVYLEPVRIRDLKMAVLNIANF